MKTKIVIIFFSTFIFITQSLILAFNPIEESILKREVLETLLPLQGKIVGWEQSSNPQFFEPGNLWEYMNGQAELYIQYGFQLLVTTDYILKKDSSSINIEIFQMESPVHAFAIYAAERSPQDKVIKIGVQGYIGMGVLNFWKGPYYVKLTTFQSSSTVEDVLLELSHIIADKIIGNYSEPKLFTYFPEKNKIKMSERYIPKNFLGQPFLENGYLANYNREGSRYQVFLVNNGSLKKAEESFQKYKRFLASESDIISHELKYDYQIVKTEKEKMNIVFQYKTIMGGVLHIDDFSEGEEIVEDMVKKLKN
ncbi:MAG: hypothetical protein JSV56_08475 [Methanomassiliicoccales archaeon]|nr:MAG: hypothetical protein JSV56_08475 [Methanomassiliicoccales archaeon]